MAPDRVGIVGSGEVAKALGRGFAKYDWDVRLGTRSPEKLRKWATETGDSASVGSFSDAASFGDLVVLAVQGAAVPDVLNAVDPSHFAGKLVLDATNPPRFRRRRPPDPAVRWN